MVAGVTPPVWLLDNFLQPLARDHASENQDIINSINANIQQSAVQMFSCTSCKRPLNPHAANPKDQELACNKCKNLFHKKCTNRRKTTANWRKSPWYCESCIMGPTIPETTTVSGVSSTLDITAPSFTPKTVSTTTVASHAQVCSTGVSDSARAVTIASSGLMVAQPATTSFTADGIPLCTAVIPTTTPSSDLSQLHPTTGTSTSPPQATYVSSQSTLARQQPVQSVSSPPCASTPPDHTETSQESQTQIQPRFPSTSTRQRSSNVNLGDPELEFLKTALSACRSTISQQEAELKRLNECLNIRNKRITQLELQVGHASDYISARNPPSHIPEHSLSVISEKLDILTRKVERQDAAVPNRIVINSCHPTQQHHYQDHYTPQAQTTGTQTDNFTDGLGNTEESCADNPSLGQTQPMQTL